MSIACRSSSTLIHIHCTCPCGGGCRLIWSVGDWFIEDLELDSVEVVESWFLELSPLSETDLLEEEELDPDLELSPLLELDLLEEEEVVLELDPWDEPDPFPFLVNMHSMCYYRGRRRLVRWAAITISTLWTWFTGRRGRDTRVRSLTLGRRRLAR